MKKVLALVLAVIMLLTLNAAAMAVDGAGSDSQIATYGIAGGKGSVDKGFVMTPGTLEINQTYTGEDFVSLMYSINDIKVGEIVQMSLYYVEINEAVQSPQDERYIVRYRYTGEAFWESSDPTIATISSSGLLKAVGTGDWSKGVAAPVSIVVTVPESAGELDYDDRDLNYFRVIAEDATLIDDYVVLRPVDDTSVAELEMKVGETVQLGAFTSSDLKPYTGDVRWKTLQNGVTVSDTGLVTIGSSIKFDWNADGTHNFKGTGDYTRISIIAEVPAAKSSKSSLSVKVVNGDAPSTPEDPNKPTTPNRPNPPVLDSYVSPDTAPQATDNAANDDKTSDDLRAGKAVEVKVTNGSSALSTETANLLGGGSGKLTLVNGGMTVTIPGGFGKVTEAGRIYYPFDYEQNPRYASDMLAAVKGENDRSEAVKAGGVMTLPTTATVTLKTRLTGTVNVYLYNEYTGKSTLVASPVAKDGTITFTTRQMGYFLLTTGRV